MITVFPAIDIRGGKCVRLLRGDYGQEAVYGHDPVDTARGFLSKGASHIHVVDLDGARDGQGKNLEMIGAIAKLGVFIQTGGGIRTIDDVIRRMELGVSRCIIGTAAVEHPQMVEEAAKRYPGRIAVGIDERDGLVATRGWETTSQVRVADLAKRMAEVGVDTVIHTDISRDGMKTGPNVEKSRALMDASGLQVVVSGGVSSIRDVEEAQSQGLYGIILGKALYDGEIDLKQALSVGRFQNGSIA